MNGRCDISSKSSVLSSDMNCSTNVPSSVSHGTEVEEIWNKNEKPSNQLETVQPTVEELMKLNADLRRRHDAVLVKHKEELKQCQEREKMLKGSLGTCTQEWADLEESKTALQKLYALEEKVEVLTEEIVEVKTKKESLNTTLCQVQKEVSQLQDTNLKLTLQLKAAETRKTELDDEVQQLNLKLQAAKKDCLLSQKTAAAESKDKNALQKELSREACRMQDLQQNIRELIQLLLPNIYIADISEVDKILKELIEVNKECSQETWVVNSWL